MKVVFIWMVNEDWRVSNSVLIKCNWCLGLGFYSVIEVG